MSKTKKHVLYSTLTASQEYASWIIGANDLRVKGPSVIVNGGANIADKFLVTPQGAVTRVDDSQLELLQSNPAFNRHVERGFIVVSEDTEKAEVEKAVTDMTGRDESAPLVPEDFEAEGKEPPSTNAAEDTPPPPPAGRRAGR